MYSVQRIKIQLICSILAENMVNILFNKLNTLDGAGGTKWPALGPQGQLGKTLLFSKEVGI